MNSYIFLIKCTGWQSMYYGDLVFCMIKLIMPPFENRLVHPTAQHNLPI